MIRLVVGNTRPSLNFQCVAGNRPINLTGATVQFKLKKPDGVVVTRSLTVVDAPNGRVSGNFGVGDLDQSGTQYGELQITFVDGGVQNAEEPFELIVRPEFFEAVL